MVYDSLFQKYHQKQMIRNGGRVADVYSASLRSTPSRWLFKIIICDSSIAVSIAVISVLKLFSEKINAVLHRAGMQHGRDRLSDTAEPVDRAKIFSDRDLLTVNQKRYIFTGVIGTRMSRVITMISRDHHDIAMLKLRQKVSKPFIKLDQPVSLPLHISSVSP